ncbi:MAG: MoxR family ATPase [Alicyclobacillus sp.]|nr:MoxR family ATPase [Alicyclobacillus sp.]
MLNVDGVVRQLTAVCNEMNKRMVGQDQVIRHTVAACIAGGHVLFEDVPGTGKTTLATSLAEVLGLDFARVQGTPDLLPSELVGTMVFHPGTAEFTFRSGPIFTQVLLMDEINRATPRTQSALLEAMAEHQVTVDGQTHRLGEPFFVMATANPIESQGVFPLPEAQLDRFLVQLKLGYTSEEEELEMVRRIRLGEQVLLNPIMTAQDVLAAREAVKAVAVVDDVLRYIVQLCRATRVHENVALGASPRSVLSLTAFAQALALLSGRTYVTPDDVQEAWLPVMRHRVRTHVEWRTDGPGGDTLDVLREVLEQVTVPAELIPGAN